MEHLFSVSAYQFDLDDYGGTEEALRKIDAAGADGVELLTGYFDPDPLLRDHAKSVHLPYAADWYSPWTGDTSYTNLVSDDNIRYRSYGRNREQITEAVRDAIVHASSIDPAYGVFHASNVRMNEIRMFAHRDSDNEVIGAVAGLLNAAVGKFRNGEPPFRIVLENLWWPGLTLKDSTGYELLNEMLEFDDWGICLDTGHLMNSLGHCKNEEQSIKDVLNIVRRYPRDMTDKIDVVHLHMSLSGDYIEKCIRDPVEFRLTDDEEVISKAYDHVSRIDQHRPFTNVLCTKIIDTVRPKYVTHEISAPTADERLFGFTAQRSLFRM